MEEISPFLAQIQENFWGGGPDPTQDGAPRPRTPPPSSPAAPQLALGARPLQKFSARTAPVCLSHMIRVRPSNYEIRAFLWEETGISFENLMRGNESE